MNDQSTLQTSQVTFCLAKVWDAHLLPSLQRGQNGRVCYLCTSGYWSRTFAPRHRTTMLTAIAEDRKEIREYLRGRMSIFNTSVRMSCVMFTGDVWLKIWGQPIVVCRICSTSQVSNKKSAVCPSNMILVAFSWRTKDFFGWMLLMLPSVTNFWLQLWQSRGLPQNLDCF